MRSEFLGACARYEGLAEAFNETQFLLPRMDKQSLVRALREPARLYRGEVDSELAVLDFVEVLGRECRLGLFERRSLFRGFLFGLFFLVASLLAFGLEVFCNLLISAKATTKKTSLLSS